MTAGVEGIALSAIDEERFGIRTARGTVTERSLQDALAFCRRERVRLFIARIGTDDQHLTHAMETEGFRLMDTLVQYTRDLRRPISEYRGRSEIRPMRPEDMEGIVGVAAKAFRGYGGHYHADPRLDPNLADEVYIDWARRSCVSRDVADEVLVADSDGRIAGFMSLRLNEPEEGEGFLNAVAPSAQGRGVYTSLMYHAMRWCVGKGAARMVMSTQITNSVVQRAWARAGFWLSGSFYTFHRWYEEM